MKFLLLATLALGSISAFADDSKVAVGILDNGFDYTHLALKNNVDTNFPGINLKEFNDDPFANFYEHGSAVSKRIVDSYPDVLLQMIKLPPAGWIGTGHILTQEQWFHSIENSLLTLYSRGVHIFNISQGDGHSTASYSFKPLCKIFEKMPNAVFVIASGNDNQNLDFNGSYSIYPAQCDLGNMLVVGSSNKSKIHKFSNYGIKSVDLFANGDDVEAFGEHFTGTSFSAPYVAGLIARLKSKKPNVHIIEIKDFITSKCRTNKKLKLYSKAGCLIDKKEAIYLYKKF